MAKRKAPKASRKAKRAARKKPSTSAKASASGARRTVRRAPAQKKASGKRGAKKPAPRKAAPAKPGRSRRPTTSARAPIRRAPAKKVAATKKAAASKKVSAPKRAAPQKTSAVAPRARGAAPKLRRTAERPVERKAPSLNRARRVVLDDDIVLSPPSTLDMDRSASAARSGRRALEDRLEEHTETGPGMTGGDIDADWESAYSVGDEAPGGDNPTPDQDIVDDIGRALGNEYQDNEPLKGADKIAQRDRHRWELDPGSKEDFGDDDV
jgi:hypothetical protein